MAVVTGRPQKDCDWFLAQHGLSGLFDATVCMESGPPKPSPAPFKLACERLGVAASEAVIVGDTPDDVLSGLSAGGRGVGVALPHDFARAVLDGADYKAGGLSKRMLELGAEGVIRPGLADLLDLFPRLN
jgi:phosphoglycolate phosphatase-like HAD superfamily hydrolase